MTNVDFSPSVFESGEREPIKSRSSFWSLGLVIFATVLLLVCIVAYIFSMKTATRPQSELVRFVSPDVPMLKIPANVISRASEPENCTGSEVICTVATASKPAELLRKLVAAIPTATAKQYRVRLSVTAIEEPAGDNTADSSTP